MKMVSNNQREHAGKARSAMKNDLLLVLVRTVRGKPDRHQP